MRKIGGPYAEPLKGRGYFNEGQGASAGLAKQTRKAQEPYVSRDGDKTEINLDPTYHETLDAAWRAYQPESKNVDKNAVSLWTMPWQDRDAYVALLQAEGCYTQEEFDALMQQADMFGEDSLSAGGKALVAKGPDMFKAGADYVERVSLSSKSSKEDYMDDLHDTGRYVRLQSPYGDVSQYLMELRPMMDVHRFLDLEAPEGTAQILEFREGDYTIFGEYENCELVQDGIAAAREYKAEHGIIYTTEGGTVRESELLTQFGGVSERDLSPQPVPAPVDNTGMPEPDGRPLPDGGPKEDVPGPELSEPASGAYAELMEKIGSGDENDGVEAGDKGRSIV